MPSFRFAHHFLYRAAVLSAGLTLFSLCGARSARAIVVLGGRDASGIFTNSGSNLSPTPFGLDAYLGNFGYALAAPISSQYFVTATHVGNAGSGGLFTYNNGTSTNTTYRVSLAGTKDDLAVWKITPDAAHPAAIFTNYAPLYTNSNEVGTSLVMVGNGYSRGNAINSPPITDPKETNRQGNQAGWALTTTQVRSWGTNTVDYISTANGTNKYTDFASPGGPFYGDFLTAGFDRHLDANGNVTNPDEGFLAPYDSGSVVFALDAADGRYKVAGVNSLDSRFVLDASGKVVEGAFFDVNGFYYQDPENNNALTQYNESVPVIAGSYFTRISSRQSFIYSITGSISPVPEPGLWVSFGLASVGGLGMLRRKRMRQAK